MAKTKDIKVKLSSGEDFQLSKMSEKFLVLFFYPKDSTPGCTVEGHEFTKLLPKFAKLGAKVLGISRDSHASHCKFIAKQGYKHDLISDEDEKICTQFEVIKEKNMYGKKVMGIERSTFVLDSKLNVVHEWRKVKAEGHAQEVLEKLKEL